MALRIEFEVRAERELDEALQWYRDIHPLLAENFFAEYLHVRDSILEFPRRFPHMENSKARSACFCRRFPYSIVYLEDGEVIRIFSIFHHRRKPEHWVQ